MKTAHQEDLVHAVVNCRVCELAITLYLLTVAICKWSVNPITNPNHVRSNSHDNINPVITYRDIYE
jgi:hypothetical protein